jgi:hypothetical protein
MRNVWIGLTIATILVLLIWYLGFIPFLWCCLWIFGFFVAVAIIRGIFRAFWENFVTRDGNDT